MNKQEIQETINELHRMKKRLSGAQGCSVHHEEANAYSARCLSIAITALEKQIPKRVNGVSVTHEGQVGNCPSCGKFITHRKSKCVCGYENCLQRLDWSGEAIDLECGRMGDLISREALYEAISYALYSSIRLDVSDIRDIINNQLTAYDVDKVDGQMEACRWVKGLHSFETCWSDVSIKDYKKYAMRFCPKCGKKIKVV